MRLLGIDFGTRKIGLSISVNGFPEPLTVVRYKDTAEALNAIQTVLAKEMFDKIVVGLSENEIGKATKRFAGELRNMTDIPVEYQDETLTTQETQRLAIEAGIRRTKRKGMEDAYAACLILTAYIDTHENK